jgi:hypothetical protein
VLEDRHRPVGLEGFPLLAFLVEHHRVLGEEDHQEGRRQGFSRLLDLVVHQEDLPLAFNHLRDFKGRLVRGEDFHHQVLEGGDTNEQPVMAVLTSGLNASWSYSSSKQVSESAVHQSNARSQEARSSRKGSGADETDGHYYWNKTVTGLIPIVLRETSNYRHDFESRKC